MAQLKAGTSIGGYPALHVGNISAYAIAYQTVSTPGLFDTSTTNPTATTRLNYNGAFYATTGFITGDFTASRLVASGGETRLQQGAWVDPHSGTSYALKVSGGSATDTLRVTGATTSLGTITTVNIVATNQLSGPNFNAGDPSNGTIELGRRDGTTATPALDFHTGSATNDYDSRIMASGPLGASTINVIANNFQHNGTAVSLNGHTHTFASLTSIPTTLAGYGITDAVSKTPIASKLFADAPNTYPVGTSIFETGIGITQGWPTDFISVVTHQITTVRIVQIITKKEGDRIWWRGSNSDGSGWSPVVELSTTTHSHTFAALTAKPTTLSGFGITDALNSTNPSVTGVVTTTQGLKATAYHSYWGTANWGKGISLEGSALGIFFAKRGSSHSGFIGKTTDNFIRVMGSVAEDASAAVTEVVRFDLSNNETTFNGNTYTSGVARATGGFLQESSRELKTDIADYTDNALSIVNATKITTFRYKNDTTNESRIGFIAEDTPSELSGVDQKAFRIGDTVAVLLKAVQELTARIETLEAQLAS